MCSVIGIGCNIHSNKVFGHIKKDFGDKVKVVIYQSTQMFPNLKISQFMPDFKCLVKDVV